MNFDAWLNRSAPPSYLARLSAEVLEHLRDAYEAGFAAATEDEDDDYVPPAAPTLPKPGVKFRGGPRDGGFSTMNPLISANRIDPWDDRTIEANLASPMVPVAEFHVQNN